MSVPETSVGARELVWRLFRDAADEDYLVARWAASQQLANQFVWSAQQAIEKYMKCALLLNGIDVNTDGHDLCGLYKKCTDAFDRLISSVFCPPKETPADIPVAYGRFEPFNKFIERLNQMGDPNNRYRYYNLRTEIFDLYKLDELCFQVRRVCHPLGLEFLTTGRTVWQILSEHPQYQLHPSMAFITNTHSSRESERWSIFRWNNFSFFDDEEREINPSMRWFSMQISPIKVVAQIKPDQEAIQWLLDNAWFSRADRDYIRAMVVSETKTQKA